MKIQQKTKQYHSCSHRVYSCQYHVIFCPKYRRPVLVNGIDIRLKQVFKDIAIQYKFTIIEQDVMSDHVHLLIDVNPYFGITKAVARLKGISSKTLREEYPKLKMRLPSLWTRSAFISSVGSVSLERVQQYIANQKGI